jgi:hypothetical protein
MPSFSLLSDSSCPTLLIESAFIPPKGVEQLYARLLRQYDYGAHYLASLRAFPGDPWNRVSADVEATTSASASAAPERDLRRLTEAEAFEFAGLQLQPTHALAELQAFLAAWQGAVDFQIANRARLTWMELQEFNVLFKRLIKYCRLPE